MSLGLTSSFNINKLDLNNINEVSKQILSKNTSSQKSTNIDYTQFNRAYIGGTDLYSTKTSANTASLIGKANAGYEVQLNQQTINALQYLNTQAAKTANLVGKNVDGKLSAPVSEGEKSQPREVFELPKATLLFSASKLDRDKKGSTGFTLTKNQAETQTKNNEDEQDKSIFLLS